jgi:hypothetical protein
MKGKFIYFFVLLFTFSEVNSQNISIEVYGSPALSIIQTSYNFKYHYLTSFNPGLKVGYRHNKLNYSIGLLHLTQGAKWPLEVTTASNPEGTGQYENYYLRAKSIIGSIQLDYFIFERNKIRLFGGGGLLFGKVYSQEMEMPDKSQNLSGVFVSSPYAYQKYVPLAIVDELYIGVNFGVGFKYNVYKGFGTFLRPNIIYQIRNSKSANIKENRLVSYSLDIGISYNFK